MAPVMREALILYAAPLEHREPALLLGSVTFSIQQPRTYSAVRHRTGVRRLEISPGVERSWAS